MGTVTLKWQQEHENTTILSIKTVTGKISVNPKWEEVRLNQPKPVVPQLNQPKPVVPQMIFDVIESFDENKDYLHQHMSRQPSEVREWLTYNERDFYEAWLAYPNITVEKEKLYTVEIPNPNGCNLYLIKLDKEVVITSGVIADVFPDNLKLTEQEIRKDYDWA